MKNSIIIGIVSCFLVAIVAFFFGKTYPLIGGAVFGITIGIVLNAVFPKTSEKISVGTSLTGRKVLQYSIILLGFEMNIREVISVGLSSLWIMLFTLLATVFNRLDCCKSFED